MDSIWCITGTTSGFGKELALHVLANGGKVIATARNPASIPSEVRENGAHVIALDLSTSASTIQSACDEALKVYGKVDVLVNNAGYSGLGAIEETTDEEVRQNFQTNFFGLLSVTRAFLPSMRQNRSGTVVNISSQVGIEGFAGCGIYSATKFAVEGLSEALAKELEPFNIRVLIVEPGPFRSDFLKKQSSGTLVSSAIPAYDETPARAISEALQNNHGKQAGDVQKGVRRIFEVVTGTGMAAGKKELLRLPLGTVVEDSIKSKVDFWQQTLAEYTEICRSTDFS
ncbi:MAG: hypothetical protein M1837_002629 [Sclerophora amabilis]|nr:MAG: hypothetical protein M1837_002629 [Sclerophora amabilis]